MIWLGYHVPPGPHPDYAAVELLSGLLGDAPSGRLHKRLTERQLAAATFGFSMALADPGALILAAQLAPGQELDAARKTVASLEEHGTEHGALGVEVVRRDAGRKLSHGPLDFGNCRRPCALAASSARDTTSTGRPS